MRPHPFEKDNEYILLSKKFKNCQIDYSEDLTKTLFDVKLFLHVDCTTAVRTNLLNIPTISLDWLIKNKKKDPYNKISNDISYKCNNIIKLNKLIKSLNIPVNKNNLKIINNFYGSFDGKNCIRLANEISKIKLETKKIDFKKSKNTIKQKLKYVLLKIINSEKYLKLKLVLKKVRDKKKNKYKSFNVKKVKELCLNKNIQVSKSYFESITMESKLG